MKEIIIPSGKRLSWYLAAEEYFAKNITEESIFFWKVRPTVIFGRHQVMENEVNLTYCRAHDVDLVRRKSGGGCVYADEGNLMTSYLSPSTHSEQVFEHYLAMMASALRQLGVPAVTTEHNDILVEVIGDRQQVTGQYKVSGNASYALPTGTIVHGTMLYDVDFDALEQAITPDSEKLAKHGVASVRQRVINIQPLLALLDISELKNQLSQLLCDGSKELTKQDIAAIETIEQTYERFL